MSQVAYRYRACLLVLAILLLAGCQNLAPQATGDLGLVIERATGSVQIINTSSRTSLARIEGLGDLSHASVVYSRDERYAYIFGRDGGLSKVDMLLQRIDKRIIQSGNSIGGAISQDGSLIAVSNYEPGGVKVFDAHTLQRVADIPALGENGKRSKVVGLVDAPRQRFVFSLYESDEIWIADMRQPDAPEITRYRDVGRQPYDALISGEGRYYIAGLFGEDGLALLDLWQPQAEVKRILGDYGRGEEKLPVYKMPHLEGWAMAGNYALVPAVGGHEVLVIERENWQLVKRIPVHSQPIFVMASPDQRSVWVNFAHPDNDTIQVIDVASLEVIDTLKPGPAVLHMEFTPRGHEVWVSVRDANRVRVYDTYTRREITSIKMESPSGDFSYQPGTSDRLMNHDRQLSELERHLLNDYQHDFPLSPTPYADMAEQLGISEQQVLDSLDKLQQEGLVSRVGAVFRPNRVGASTLAAMSVAEDELEAVAAIINSYPHVNHNYEREHEFNLWFVATAGSEAELCSVLGEMEEITSHSILALPLLEDYHIDLGFDLQWT